MILDLRFWILDWGRARMKAIASARVSDSYSDNRKSKTCTELRRSIQNPKWLGLSVIAFVLVVGGVVAQAQQPTKVPRIGYLSTNTPAAMSTRTEAFRQGLHELGYVEGKNIVIEYRYAEGKRDRLPKLAAELVRLNVDIIVSAGGEGTASPAKQATNTIPIVMTNVTDPVGTGFVASLARPGANITGLAALTEDLAGKRVELLKETFPKISRMAVLLDPEDPSKVVELKLIQAPAKVLGVILQAIEVRSNDFQSAFNAATRERAGALLVLQNGVTNTGRKPIAELATKHRLPTMWAESGLMDAGGLMSYGPSYADIFRRAAIYVDKILKGAKPADLPVEQPTKFELVINLKTAKQIGLTIPPNVLARADKVIK
jgi:putative ABC transport system substrate-binding protein